MWRMDCRGPGQKRGEAGEKVTARAQAGDDSGLVQVAAGRSGHRVSFRIHFDGGTERIYRGRGWG